MFVGGLEMRFILTWFSNVMVFRIHSYPLYVNVLRISPQIVTTAAFVYCLLITDYMSRL
jgi:hypothetical protein